MGSTIRRATAADAPKWLELVQATLGAQYPVKDIYKQVLKTEPNNVDAMKALASVLYREDKIDESAAILDKLPRN